jgi:hypothetical protein
MDGTTHVEPKCDKKARLEALNYDHRLCMFAFIRAGLKRLEIDDHKVMLMQ